MREAKLNGSKINIQEITVHTKDRKFNCINRKCDCEVIVAAYDSLKVKTYFRAKNEHDENCYIGKIYAGGSSNINRKTLTKLTYKWTMKDIYNLIKHSNLNDEIVEGIKLQDLEISSRNEKKFVDKDKVYYIIFTPTFIGNNEKGKGLIHGEIGSKKITVVLSEKLELPKGKDKVFPDKTKWEILLVAKVSKAKKDGRYLAYDVRSENIEMFKKENK